MKKIISNIEYNIGYDKNSIPELNIKYINIFYEQVKFKITDEANKIYDNQVKKVSNEIFQDYANQMIEQIENIYQFKNDSFEFLQQYSEIVDIIDNNINEEIEEDLNNLYQNLFKLMRQYIILDNDNTSLDDISKEYFDKISEFLDKNIGHSVNNSELSKNDQIREIVFICIKRMKETQINYIKE